MSAQMQQAANDAGPGASLEAARPHWKAHSQVKRNPADTAGVLDDVNAPQPWEKYATSDDITAGCLRAVRGDMPTLTKLGSLTPETPNRAIAETIAAKGQPAPGRAWSTSGRMCLRKGGARASTRTSWTITEQQAPGAGNKLQAVDAAKTTAEPMERAGSRGCWRRSPQGRGVDWRRGLVGTAGMLRCRLRHY